MILDRALADRLPTPGNLALHAWIYTLQPVFLITCFRCSHRRSGGSARHNLVGIRNAGRSQENNDSPASSSGRAS